MYVEKMLGFVKFHVPATGEQQHPPLVPETYSTCTYMYLYLERGQPSTSIMKKKKKPSTLLCTSILGHLEEFGVT